MIRQPRFWTNPPSQPGALARILEPLGRAGGWLAAQYQRRAKPVRCPIPVISVGNIAVGGQGKTPLAIALAQWFVERDIAVHLVSRGYRGSEAGPHRVDPTADDYKRVGDEPLLLANHAPTWIARDRAAGVRAAASAGAEVAILDDGHQTTSITKDLSIVAVDTSYMFGNERVLPAGPLREPLDLGLARADAIVAIGESPYAEPATVPVLTARIRPVLAGLSLASARVFAFAGIAQPEKFFTTLRSLGAQVLRAESFPDHYPYPILTLQRLVRDADQLGALLVTTEKDAVRLPPQFRTAAVVQRVRVVFEDPPALEQLLGPLVSRIMSVGSQ